MPYGNNWNDIEELRNKAAHSHQSTGKLRSSGPGCCWGFLKVPPATTKEEQEVW
jgi:hypothetical protein